MVSAAPVGVAGAGALPGTVLEEELGHRLDVAKFSTASGGTSIVKAVEAHTDAPWACCM